VINRPVRAYTYELCESTVPQDLLETLGEKSWVWQARILAFATTAKSAKDQLAKLGIRNTKPPRVAYGNDVDALVFAEYGKSGSVFVLSENGGNVAEVMLSSDGSRDSRLIGSIDYKSALLMATQTKESNNP
jgi:hypothetical protein